MESKSYKFDDRVEWRNEIGQLHRLDDPAIEWTNGDKHWYQNGHLHRIDGPAIECNNGDKIWYRDGLYHRWDGPAVEWSNGYREYRINGKPYFPLFIEFDKIIKKIKKYGK